MLMKKFWWYAKKLSLFCWVCLRLFFYFLFHPLRIKELLFPIFSSINEFYTVSHGGLKNFEKTKLFEKIAQRNIFAQSNLFDRDSKVTRSMETHFLSTLIKAVGPETIFEIGTYNGFTTLHLAVNSQPSCRIFTLDLPENYDERQASRFSYDDLLVVQLSNRTVLHRFYKGHPLEGKIKELFGDSSAYDYSPYEGKMDVVFIDGNHSFEFVKKDTENAFKMLSSQGIIVWHDFDYIIHKDVFRYLQGLGQNYRIYSVPNTRFAIYGKNIA
jgi:predicted O-methyltransferase YrrM